VYNNRGAYIDGVSTDILVEIKHRFSFPKLGRNIIVENPNLEPIQDRNESTQFGEYVGVLYFTNLESTLRFFDIVIWTTNWCKYMTSIIHHITLKREIGDEKPEMSYPNMAFL
jgi:hypothetical protein